jgi:DNA/RNA non-specific endonuclease
LCYLAVQTVCAERMPLKFWKTAGGGVVMVNTVFVDNVEVPSELRTTLRHNQGVCKRKPFTRAAEEKFREMKPKRNRFGVIIDDKGHLLAICIFGRSGKWNISPMSKRFNQGRSRWKSNEMFIYNFLKQPGSKVNWNLTIEYENKRNLKTRPTCFVLETEFFMNGRLVNAKVERFRNV